MGLLVGPQPSMPFSTNISRIVAMVVGFCGCLLFLFVPESFWDRTPIPKSRKTSKYGSWLALSMFHSHGSTQGVNHSPDNEARDHDHNLILEKEAVDDHEGIATPKKAILNNGTQPHRDLHVGFAERKSVNSTDETITPSNNRTMTQGDIDGKIVPLYLMI